MDQKRSATPWWWVPAVACALLAVVALWLGPGGAWAPSTPLRGPLAGGHVLLGVLLLLVLGALALWFARRARRSGGRTDRLDAGLAVALAAAAVALPVMLIAASPVPSATAPPTTLTAPATTTAITAATTTATGGGTEQPAAGHAKSSSSSLPWVILAALLSIGCGLVLGYDGQRRFRRRHTGGARGAVGRRAPAVPDGSPADAIAAGLAALDAQDDPRLAVIACYVALEHGLRGAGVPRYRSDTATELLDRATRLGTLSRTDAGAELTSLYLEARFSRHSFDGTRRDAARAALDVLRTELAALSEQAEQAEPAGPAGPATRTGARP